MDNTPSSGSFGEITRGDWKALNTKARVELWSPVNRVLLVYGTNTESCFTPTECVPIIQTLQWEHMYQRRMPDINYNFLIGEDRNVYEGRGFQFKSSLQSEYVPNSLVIGFIGDWSVEDPPEMFFEITDAFIKRYVKQGKISVNYRQYFVRGY